MRASLPMYDHPALRADHARYWQRLRQELQRRGVGAPDELSCDGLGVDFWTRDDLVLSQTCGYPYRMQLAGKVALIGTPDYGVEGCAPGFYRSLIVVRQGGPFRQLQDLGGARFAFNDRQSQSGYHALFACGEKAGIEIAPTLETGSHRQSIAAIADGAADFAAIDAVSWRIFQKFEPCAGALTVIARTQPTPGLPYICAKKLDAARIADAVICALSALNPATRSRLGIKGFERLTPEAYLAVNKAPPI